MSSEIKLYLESRDSGLAEAIARAPSEIRSPRVLVQHSRESGPPASPPDIALLHDDPQEGDILQRISAWRQRYPQTSIFVISANNQPEQIVQVMKTGASEYFFDPPDLQKIRDVLVRHRKETVADTENVEGTIYSFIGSKGGLGTTLIAVNTAVAVALRNGGKTGFLDLSLQTGDSSVFLDILPETTLSDICKNMHRLDRSFLRSAMTRHGTGLDVLPAPAHPEEGLNILAEQVKKILTLEKSLYENFIVDCSSVSINELTLEAFRNSEIVFIVTDFSIPAIRNTTRLMKFLQKYDIPFEKMEIVANRFTKDHTGSLEEIENSLKKRLFWLFPEDENAEPSINRGIPLVKYDGKSPMGKSLFDFARKLEDPMAQKNYRGVKGFLGKAI